jgi:hypothetical protein
MAVLKKETRTYTERLSGIESIWYFDPEKSRSGPYRVEHKYSKEFLEDLKEKKKRVVKNK